MDIIGSGGFGNVTIDLINQNYIIKHINNNCACAEYEFAIHQIIHRAFIYYIDHCADDVENPELDNIWIPTPSTFQKHNSIECSYKMERLFYIPPSQYNDIYALNNQYIPMIKTINSPKFIHICLNQESCGNVSMELGIDRKKPIDDGNRSRGIFMIASDIQKLYKKYDKNISKNNVIQHIVRQIGILYGIILFGAGMIPHDVEYGVGLKPGTNNIVIAAIDFGNCVPHNYQLNIESATQCCIPKSLNQCGILGYTSVLKTSSLDTLWNKLFNIGIDEYFSFNHYMNNFMSGFYDVWSVFNTAQKDYYDNLYDPLKKLYNIYGNPTNPIASPMNSYVYKFNKVIKNEFENRYGKDEDEQFYIEV